MILKILVPFLAVIALGATQDVLDEKVVGVYGINVTCTPNNGTLFFKDDSFFEISEPVNEVPTQYIATTVFECKGDIPIKSTHVELKVFSTTETNFTCTWFYQVKNEKKVKLFNRTDVPASQASFRNISSGNDAGFYGCLVQNGSKAQAFIVKIEFRSQYVILWGFLGVVAQVLICSLLIIIIEKKTATNKNDNQYELDQQNFIDTKLTNA